MKVYAKQVPPEYQESPLFLGDCFPENIAVYGNERMNDHIPAIFERVHTALECAEIIDAWEEQQRGYGYKTWADALRDLVPVDGRGPYTREERKRWPKLALEYYTAKRGSYEEENALCEALELATGKPWETGTIRGCSQGDWQNVCYPADDWSRDDLARFEAEYFNTGTEWIIDPDGNSVSVYVTAWDDDGTRQELADAYGCEASDIILQKFTGWSKTANYEEA